MADLAVMNTVVLEAVPLSAPSTWLGCLGTLCADAPWARTDPAGCSAAAAAAATERAERSTAAAAKLRPALPMAGAECCICSAGSCHVLSPPRPNRGLLYRLVVLKSRLAERKREALQLLLMSLPQLYTDAATADAVTAEGEEDCEPDSSPVAAGSLGTELALRAIDRCGLLEGLTRPVPPCCCS